MWLLRFIKIGRQLKDDDYGSAVLEMAVLGPFLVVLLAGFIEFSMAIQQRHVIQKSLRDAGRYLARIDAQAAGTYGTSCPGATTTETTYAKNLAMYGDIQGSTNGARLKIPGWTASDICILGPASVTRGTSPSWTGQLVTVTASVTYADVGFLSLIGFNNITLSGSHEQAYLPTRAAP